MKEALIRLIYITLGFILMLIVLVTMGCAKQYVPLRHTCLPEPVLEKVEVVGGTIDKPNTKKVISNHVKVWEYVEYLLIKACKKH